MISNEVKYCHGGGGGLRFARFVKKGVETSAQADVTV